jgi:hypothetical protein
MDISGKLIQLLQAQTGQGKNGTWKKQEFILETTDAYPKKVCIAVWGDKIDLAKFKIGDPIDVSFDVESREYNSKWYTDVKAWKVNAARQKDEDSTPPPPSSVSYDEIPQGDDLPF